MIQWWNELTLAMQVFAIIGIAATVLLAIQMVLMLIGAASGGADGAGAGDGDLDFGDPADLGPADAEFPDLGEIDGAYEAGLAGEMALPGAGPGDIAAPTDFGAAEMPEGADGYELFESGAPLPDTHSGLHLFTLQGIVAFAAIFGWSGLVMLKMDFPFPLALILALVFGFIAMVLIALLLRAMLKLQHDGSLNIRNAIGKSGTVYLPIHEKRALPGKVSILVQGRLMELDAVTDEGEKIPTGHRVTVVGIAGNNTLIVRTVQ